MDRRDLALEWFRIAEMDLASAQYLAGMDAAPYGIVCFHCQQSAEKYLKGFLDWNGRETPKTHDLKHLNDLCAQMNPDFSALEEDCIELVDYAVVTRYPFYLDMREDEMLSALVRARKIRDFVQSVFRS